MIIIKHSLGSFYGNAVVLSLLHLSVLADG